MQIVAYLLSAWCYLVAVVAIVWLVPHACRKYGRGAQVGVLLLAMALVVVGYEAWSVAEGVEIAEYWLFRKSLIPAATTSIILLTVVFALALFNIWHLAVEHVERREKRELSQIKAELLAEVKGLKERLDAQLLRQSEAKSDFDLFNEQFIRSRDKQ